MPRSGMIGTYSLPPNTNNQAPNTPISSSMFNSFASDVQQTFNDPTPIAYGGTGAATVAAAATALNFKWLSKGIGELYAVNDAMAGVDIPPNNDPDFRFIKLTASDAYNSGVLTSESVSGSAPLVIATAVINDAASPLNGKTVNLINTERRVLRAGSAGTLQDDQFQSFSVGTSAGPLFYRELYPGSGTFGGVSDSGVPLRQVNQFHANGAGTPRVGAETRPKNVGVTYFMRIR